MMLRGRGGRAKGSLKTGSAGIKRCAALPVAYRFQAA